MADDFTRNVRLKRAAQLLTDSPTLSINEVSDRVGFGTARNQGGYKGYWLISGALRANLKVPFFMPPLRLVVTGC